MSSESLATKPVARRKNRTGTRFFAAGGVLVLALAFLIYNGMQGTSASFYMTVDDLQTSSEVAAGKQIRVGGDVVPGTIQRGAIGEEIRFQITDGVATTSVVYNGAAPDIFADHAEVIATGTVGPDGTFIATELLTKCPSRFEESKDDVG